MNATQSKAGSLREYLISFSPEVWDQVVRNDLHGAACFVWPEEKMRHLGFRGFHQNGVFSDGGFLDLPNADLFVKQYGNMPWAGLPPERLRREVRTSGKTVVSARPKYREEVELALGLNRAIADWLGRPYKPETSHESERYGTILVERAAQTGDVQELYGLFETYGYDIDDKRYLPALRTAAYRKHRDFVRALCERIGPALSEAAYAKCELDEVMPEDKQDTLMLYDGGVPVPAQHKLKAAQWMAQALVEQKPKGRNGVLAPGSQPSALGLPAL